MTPKISLKQLKEQTKNEVFDTDNSVVHELVICLEEAVEALEEINKTYCMTHNCNIDFDSERALSGKALSKIKERIEV